MVHTVATTLASLRGAEGDEAIQQHVAESSHLIRIPVSQEFSVSEIARYHWLLSWTRLDEIAILNGYMLKEPAPYAHETS